MANEINVGGQTTNLQPRDIDTHNKPQVGDGTPVSGGHTMFRSVGPTSDDIVTNRMGPAQSASHVKGLLDAAIKDSKLVKLEEQGNDIARSIEADGAVVLGGGIFAAAGAVVAALSGGVPLLFGAGVAAIGVGSFAMLAYGVLPLINEIVGGTLSLPGFLQRKSKGDRVTHAIGKGEFKDIQDLYNRSAPETKEAIGKAVAEWVNAHRKRPWDQPSFKRLAEKVAAPMAALIADAGVPVPAELSRLAAGR